MTMTNEGDFARDEMAALALMEQALALLDRCDCGLESAPHLDLAICRLRDCLGLDEPGTIDVASHFDAQPWGEAPGSFAA
jgi:hypothetical protein